MGYIKFNPNPNKIQVGDCVIRALSLATQSDWETTYIKLLIQGLKMADMPSSNHVWGKYLINNGFRKYPIPDFCPNCYTIKDFCRDNPRGLFVLATGTHVVTAVDGNYYDSWDSGNEIPIYYFKKEE